MSMFRSPNEQSSSDSQSSSDEWEDDVAAEHEHEHEHPQTKGNGAPLLPAGKDSENPDDAEPNKGLLDVDTEGHANMMTASLLEFFCLTRAADILNAQKGSHQRFTRDSPEVKYLGKQMYIHKSQFLSSHGVLSRGIERDEYGATRQYYRDNLDRLGMAGLQLDDVNGATPSIAAGATDTSQALQLRPNTAHTDMLPSIRQGFGMADGKQRLIGNDGANPLENIQLDMRSLLNRPLHLPGSSPVSYPLFQPTPPPPNGHLSRYAMEFSEVKVLGRGSFGEVYHVKNHIDGQSYAIKKIPLSQRRLQQLQCGNQNQLETIMKEIRTLARLEHTHVVRYYGAWVEQAHPSSYPPPQPIPQASVDLELEPTQSSFSSHGMTDNQSFGVVFEHSEQSERSSSHHQISSSDHESEPSNPHPSAHSTEDDEVESIPRNFSPRSHDPLSTWDETDDNDDDIFTDGMSEAPSKLQIQRRYRPGTQLPAVILHIQMSLHPISLNSYLNPQPSIPTPRHEHNNNNTSLPRRHCYHLIPSLNLLLDILSGVDYLHTKGIIHRDLKPANIFLSTPSHDTKSRSPPHSTCPPCHSTHGPTPRYTHPRIGDFGLVADISHISDCPPEPASTQGKKITHVVGTEFYRPPFTSPSTASTTKTPTDAIIYSIDETLDIYALGVILFELLYPLNTKMERQMVLTGLTRGSPGIPGPCFPEDFDRKIDMGCVVLDGEGDGIFVAEVLRTCIRGMLEPDARKRWRFPEIRGRLEWILSCVRE
ncbi:kinase-like protein [Aspergillus heteromorphus CBS 117.55]|uniref:Kinase-like protein n=1 Tax=Aspergillus heteromorphus CBS 117.55 TaxID=1448321 RepID=A0A317WQH8_9EURO|nr:kinase-like protein [Aspergillus heteromorphus CBS 117.55]PWY87542.1 kinase-like protein [Aspergillus heteromorphus CBS 117.55]